MANKPKYLSEDEELKAKQEQYNAVGDADMTALKDAVGKVQNRQPFNYNYQNDPMYANLREAAMRNGQMAMKDTMGKATALTGGYMNSYAQQVGQQTYNQYMDALNDKIPQLEQIAYERYRQGIEDDIKNIDIQQMLYGNEQGQKDAERDRLANEYKNLYQAKSADYALMNAPYENELNLDYQRRLGEQNNAQTIAREKALAGLSGGSGGAGGAGGSGGSGGNGGSGNTPSYSQTDRNNAVNDYNRDIGNGNYNKALSAMAGYVNNGMFSIGQGESYVANSLLEGVGNKKISNYDAVNYYNNWLTQFANESNADALESMFFSFCKQIGTYEYHGTMYKWDSVKNRWVATSH